LCGDFIYELSECDFSDYLVSVCMFLSSIRNMLRKERECCWSEWYIAWQLVAVFV